MRGISHTIAGRLTHMESRVRWQSRCQHNHNDVLVSRSHRADDVPGITRCCCESPITHKLDVVFVTINPLRVLVTDLCIPFFKAFFDPTKETYYKNADLEDFCHKSLCVIGDSQT